MEYISPARARPQAPDGRESSALADIGIQDSAVAKVSVDRRPNRVICTSPHGHDRKFGLVEKPPLAREGREPAQDRPAPARSPARTEGTADTALLYNAHTAEWKLFLQE